MPIRRVTRIAPSSFMHSVLGERSATANMQLIRTTSTVPDYAVIVYPCEGGFYWELSQGDQHVNGGIAEKRHHAYEAAAAAISQDLHEQSRNKEREWIVTTVDSDSSS